ncbi:MAG: sel1 repeat family protein [Nitrospina sp.]|nr:sel1 repeat family protein [Nitrospina sp.]
MNSKPVNLLQIISVQILILLFVTACSDSFEEGMKAYKNSDYRKAYDKLISHAKKGNPEAQVIIGEIFDNGRGAIQDMGKAAGWYHKAAEQGQVVGQYNLGVMYHKGEGVKQDFAEAVNWYGQAAEQQYALAQFSMGVAHVNGEGVEKDYIQAKMWFHLAAENGYANRDNEKVEEYLSEEEIKEALKLAEEWMGEHQEK